MGLNLLRVISNDSPIYQTAYSMTLQAGLLSLYKGGRSGGSYATLRFLWTCSSPLRPSPLSRRDHRNTFATRRIRTMDSSGMLRGLLFIGLLSFMCRGQATQEVSAEDFGAQNPAAASEKELVRIVIGLLIFRDVYVYILLIFSGVYVQLLRNVFRCIHSFLN